MKMQIIRNQLKPKSMIMYILLIIIIFLSAVALHGYLHGVMAPPYSPKEMILHYERIGNGKQKILLLHGLTGSLRYWKRGLQYAPEESSILAIDLLGFGDSPKPNSKYDIPEHLDAIEKVLEQEGFDEGGTLIVAHSLGTILSMALAGKHPDWFDGLALIGLPNYKEKAAIKTKFSQSSLFDALSVDSDYKFICFFHPLYITEFFRPKNIPKDIFKDVGKHTWVSYYRTLDEVIINSNLPELATKINDKKILFIHGESDNAAPIENAEALLPLFNKAKFERLKEADHQVYLAAPEKVWFLIELFFKRKSLSNNNLLKGENEVEI